MTEAAPDLLRAFDVLSAADRQEVAAEILRRAGALEDMSEAAFDHIADELFRSYDAEEAFGS